MIEVRALASHNDLTTAVRLQQEIWGFADVELLPVRLFVVATKIGGQVFGAFDGDRMIGFCLAIPGLKADGQFYLHSHMLGVRAEYRNAGVGRLLKLQQRADALARGIRLMEWTFDPLELKNAYFNMERLGCIVRRYVLNQYGTTSSHLHGGLPTDRCIAEWWLDSARVNAVLAGDSVEKQPALEEVSLPTDIAAIRVDDPERARQIQLNVSKQFVEFFGRDLAVIGFARNNTLGTYLLGRWQSK